MRKRHLFYLFFFLLPCILSGCKDDDGSKHTEVEIPLQSISFDQALVELKEGDTCILKVSFQPADATNQQLNWSSSNNDIAQVDSLGHVTALHLGEAMVTAESALGHTANCLVKVRGKVTGEIDNTQTDDGESTGKIEW